MEDRGFYGFKYDNSYLLADYDFGRNINKFPHQDFDGRINGITSQFDLKDLSTISSILSQLDHSNIKYINSFKSKHPKFYNNPGFSNYMDVLLRTPSSLPSIDIDSLFDDNLDGQKHYSVIFLLDFDDSQLTIYSADEQISVNFEIFGEYVILYSDSQYYLEENEITDEILDQTAQFFDNFSQEHPPSSKIIKSFVEMRVDPNLKLIINKGIHTPFTYILKRMAQGTLGELELKTLFFFLRNWTDFDLDLKYYNDIIKRILFDESVKNLVTRNDLASLKYLILKNVIGGYLSVIPKDLIDLMG